jgi:hypothetical protein
VQLLSTLLQLEKIVVGSLDTLVAVGILTLLAGNDVPKAIHITLVTLAFLLELLELEAGSIDILAERKAVVAFALNFALESKNFGFSAGDLLTKSSDLYLHVIVGSALII